MNSVIGRSAVGSAYSSLNASSAYSNARVMYSAPRIWYHSLVRRPSGVAWSEMTSFTTSTPTSGLVALPNRPHSVDRYSACLLYTSDAADEEDSVDLGG